MTTATVKTWADFIATFEKVDGGKYLPDMGEGETMASQVATAVNKLIFKWFNDGDVFDNSYLEGWCNDISSYANWLYTYLPQTRDVLIDAVNSYDEDNYTNKLYELLEMTLGKPDYMETLAKSQVVGSVYTCDGPFHWEESDDEDEEWY